MSHHETLPLIEDSQIPLVAPAITALVKSLISVPGYEALFYTIRIMVGILQFDNPHYSSALYILTGSAEEFGIFSDRILDAIENNDVLMGDLKQCWLHDKEACSKFNWQIDINIWPGAYDELRAFGIGE
jgi:hypothetical protein